MLPWESVARVPPLGPRRSIAMPLEKLPERVMLLIGLEEWM